MSFNSKWASWQQLKSEVITEEPTPVFKPVEKPIVKEPVIEAEVSVKLEHIEEENVTVNPHIEKKTSKKKNTEI